MKNSEKPRYNNSAKNSESVKAVNNSTASVNPEYLPLGLKKPDGSFEILNTFKRVAAAEVKEVERFVLIFVINA